MFEAVCLDNKFEKLNELQEKLQYNKKYKFDDLSHNFFELAHIEPSEINKIILQHWMTNTKKSVYQLPTFYDMFINFKGSQGTGKDTIASLLTRGGPHYYDKCEIEGPLYGYTAEMNFEDMFKDQFFVFGSTNYVLIISEPGGKEQASLNGAQMNQFKNITQCREFANRVFFTQQYQRIPKIFSFALH